MNLGDTVKDTVTGFVGVATGRVEYLHGTPRWLVERLDKDGKLQCEWFDEERIEKP